jgi:hypothetical protein
MVLKMPRATPEDGVALKHELFILFKQQKLFQFYCFAKRPINLLGFIGRFEFNVVLFRIIMCKCKLKYSNSQVSSDFYQYKN